MMPAAESPKLVSHSYVSLAPAMALADAINKLKPNSSRFLRKREIEFNRQKDMEPSRNL